MFSKRTKKALALTLILGIGANSVAAINAPVIAYAEDAGAISTGAQALNESSNNEESEEFKKAEKKFTEGIDNHIKDSDSPEDISEENISSIINEFSYESDVTTGSAVTIKAKNIVNFENDGSAVSFNGTLYEDKEGGATYGFNYSNTYNQPLMLTSNLLTSENTSEWSTTEDITTAEDNTVVINGFVFKLNEDKKTVSLALKTEEDYENMKKYISEQNGIIKLPNFISYQGDKYSVTKLGNYVFTNCDTLKSIELPENIESIGAMTFYGCSELQDIEIPAGVTEIGTNAFAKCSKIESIKIPTGVERIENGTFVECSNLKNIEIPSTVEIIGNSAFAKCTSLKDIQIPESVTSIGEAAFAYCTSLEKVQIPESVNSIDVDAFGSCSSLKDIQIPESLTSIGVGAFNNCNENVTVLIYKNSEDKGSAEITGIYEEHVGNTLIIPDTICGIKVTGIKEGILENYASKIQEIICYDEKIKEELKSIFLDTVKTYIDENSISVDANAIYDGKPHSIIIKGAPEGTNITYSTASNEEYTTVNPEYTGEGYYTVYYKISGEKYDNEVKGIAILNIESNPVQNIVISADGGVNAINDKGGSLKLTGAVSPSDAGIPALKWTIVSGQDLASISEDGVLTAKGINNGAVIVRAGATDGSGVVSNDLLIELENQCLNSIAISADGGVNAISTKGGSLKLNGVVSPSDAGISALKWTIVSGQDLASISEDGVLTAKGINNGAVIVRAEATDGSGVVSNELSIILQNQVSSSNGGSSSGGSSSSGSSSDGGSSSGGSSSSSSSSSGSSSSSSDEGEAKTGNGTITEGTENTNGEGNKVAINGWNLINGNWYEVLADGTYAKGWYKDVYGTWYMLDRTTGVMITRWFKDTDGSWYYLEPKSGKMATGWIEDVDGKWYYLKPSGAMETGWLQDTDGKWYYLYEDGSMAKSTIIDGYNIGGNGVWSR